ncbi:HEPN domain-containing protein [Dysgonomonas sp. ZJ279]|uniref:ApeA N-terminal domain 1-containing protein n=1 Tax=Dysgonomonas sp. ZJ279 TaxID=2709796 RepID=UPI0013ED8512|nr:HEPN domain-containing protein [Dysgonomonas sp. ZJ279]
MDKQSVERFEYKGYWFLPNDNENRIAGYLTFIPNERMELELIGGFEKDFFKKQPRYAIIHGITSDSQKVTLVHCHSYGSINLSCSFPITKYSCRYLIVGKHLTDINEHCFNRIKVHAPFLTKWIHPALIQPIIQLVDNNNKEESISYSFSSDHKMKCEVDIDSQFRLVIKSCVDLNESNNLLDVSLSQFTYFEIESISNKTNIDNLLSRARLFLEFISLASLHLANLSSITLYDSDNFQEFKNGAKSEYPIQFFERYENFRGNRTKNIKIYDFLFIYSDIKEIFSDILIKWFETKSDMAPIRGHLIKSVQEKEYFDSLDFLIIVQALEGYHTRFLPQNRPTKANGTLGYIKLPQRIKELLLLFHNVVKINGSQIDEKATVDSRNYYSHFYKRNKNHKILDGIELFELSKKLRILLICCVLHFVGFENDKINELLNKSNNNKLR